MVFAWLLKLFNSCIWHYKLTLYLSYSYQLIVYAVGSNKTTIATQEVQLLRRTAHS